MLDRLLGMTTTASRVFVWLGGIMLMFAAFMTTAEVFLRKFANYSFGGADEISGYMFAISTAFAFSYAMLQRAHVRIDAIYIHMPTPVQIFLDIMAFLALGAFLTLMCTQAYATWYGSWENSSVSITPMVTPLALPQGAWVVGLLFFIFCFSVLGLRIAQAVFQRDWDTITILLSARSVAEETEEERLAAQEKLQREHELQNRT
jgi:TRAP-type C4-dicarboxylate transport system permease small subunit